MSTRTDAVDLVEKIAGHLEAGRRDVAELVARDALTVAVQHGHDDARALRGDTTDLLLASVLRELLVNGSDVLMTYDPDRDPESATVAVNGTAVVSRDALSVVLTTHQAGRTD